MSNKNKARNKRTARKRSLKGKYGTSIAKSDSMRSARRGYGLGMGK